MKPLNRNLLTLGVLLAGTLALGQMSGLPSSATYTIYQVDAGPQYWFDAGASIYTPETITGPDGGVALRLGGFLGLKAQDEGTFPTGLTGGLLYGTDAGSLYTWSGTAWVPVGGTGSGLCGYGTTISSVYVNSVAMTGTSYSLEPSPNAPMVVDALRMTVTGGASDGGTLPMQWRVQGNGSQNCYCDTACPIVSSSGLRATCDGGFLNTCAFPSNTPLDYTVTSFGACAPPTVVGNVTVEGHCVADAGAPIPPPLTNGIVAYWNFDDNVTDVATGNHNGTWSGTDYGYLTGVIGKAGQIGVNVGGYGQLDFASFAEVTTNNWTVAGWASRDGYYPPDQSYQFTGDNFRLTLWQSSASPSTYSYSYFIYPPSQSGTYSFAFAGGWVYLAMTCSTTAGVCKQYVNGVPVGTTATTSGLGSSFNKFIGIYFGSVKFDEFGVWNRALSDAELLSLYNGGAGKTYPF